MLSEVSQTEEGKYCMLSLYVESKKKNEYNKTNRATDIENKLMVTSGEREGGRGKIGVED